MPSITIHLQIGYLISKKININSYNYYLGIIAPDSPNLNGFGIKEERWSAHIRKKDLNNWRKDLKDFYYNEIKNYPKDFLLGYYIHILTDIIYDDYFYKIVKEEIIKDNILEENAHNTMREDMDKYYFKELDIIKNILLNDNTSYNINSISKEKIILWKNKCINNFPSNNNSKYISNKLIKDLANKVYEELLMISYLEK